MMRKHSGGFPPTSHGERSSKLREQSSKLVDKIVIPDTTIGKKEITPRYMKHTVESQLKDLRIWGVEKPLAITGDEVEFDKLKKENPNLYFHVDDF